MSESTAAEFKFGLVHWILFVFLSIVWVAFVSLTGAALILIPNPGYKEIIWLAAHSLAAAVLVIQIEEYLTPMVVKYLSLDSNTPTKVLALNGARFVTLALMFVIFILMAISGKHASGGHGESFADELAVPSAAETYDFYFFEADSSALLMGAFFLLAVAMRIAFWLHASASSSNFVGGGQGSDTSSLKIGNGKQK